MMDSKTILTATLLGAVWGQRPTWRCRPIDLDDDTHASASLRDDLEPSASDVSGGRTSSRDTMVSLLAAQARARAAC